MARKTLQHQPVAPVAVRDAATRSDLADKFATSPPGALYELFVDGDTVHDPFRIQRTAANAKVCLAHNIAGIARVCAAAVEHKVMADDDLQCSLYGIGAMCDFLEAITDVHENATFQCMKWSGETEVSRG